MICILFNASVAAAETERKPVKIPDPLVFEVGNSPSNDFLLPNIITVKSEKDIISEIKGSSNGSVHGILRVATFQKAIFQRTRTFNNWFWAINGAGNIFHRLCKYMDLCSSSDIMKAAVLQPVIDSSRNLSEVGYIGLPDHHAQSAKDLMSCFGPMFW